MNQDMKKVVEYVGGEPVVKFVKGDFDESKHPRDESGKFSESGSNGAGSSSIPDKLPKQNALEAYRTPSIDLMRAIANKAGISHAHIGTNRPLVAQRKMLLDLLEEKGLVEH